MILPTAPFMRTLAACAMLLLGACAARASTDKPPHDTRVELSRSTCFGNCPSYTVTLAANGEVSFEGRSYVQVQTASGHATPAQIKTILDAVESSGFRQMQDSYAGSDEGCEVMMTDQTGMTITVSDSTGSKTVAFYEGCEGPIPDAVRPKIRQLANIIDEQLGTARWIGKRRLPGMDSGVDR